jgi:putative FmdB family regulatory protein
MPIYEYRCPDGHVFELFQRMADDPIEACQVCGGAPVEKVLYPVAVHFKGKGFYSTDYGRARKGAPSKDGDTTSTSTSTSTDSSSSDSGPSEKKAASADSKD